jgi:hypothetical protein
MPNTPPVNGQDVRKAKFALSAVAGVLFWAWLLLAICVPGVLRASKLTDAQAWPVTEATIIAAGADELCSRNAAHALRLQYDYTVAGRHFRGSQFEMFGANCYPDGRIAELVRQFPPGTPVQIRYDPGSPDESAISVDGDLGLARSQAMAGTVFFVVYSALAFACLRFVQMRMRPAVT